MEIYTVSSNNDDERNSVVYSPWFLSFKSLAAAKFFIEKIRLNNWEESGLDDQISFLNWETFVEHEQWYADDELDENIITIVKTKLI